MFGDHSKLSVQQEWPFNTMACHPVNLYNEILHSLHFPLMWAKMQSSKKSYIYIHTVKQLCWSMNTLNWIAYTDISDYAFAQCLCTLQSNKQKNKHMHTWYELTMFVNYTQITITSARCLLHASQNWCKSMYSGGHNWRTPYQKWHTLLAMYLCIVEELVCDISFVG